MPRLYEVEFEMQKPYMLEWLSNPDEANCHAKIQEMTQELYQLLHEFVPFDIEQGAMLEEANDLRLHAAIKKCTDSILDLSPESPVVFPGSMPFSMSRKNLEVVCKNSYFVTEKTDGVRYLLYIVNDSTNHPAAVLFDRAKKIRLLSGSASIAKALGLETVLDGELVYDSAMKKNVFLVFDILAINGRSLTSKLFNERFHILHTDIAECLRNINNTVDSTPIVIKNFLPKRDLRQLLKCISIDGLSKVFSDPRSRQQHKTDGLIFQPDLCYKPFLDNNMVKWKYSDLCTVDMLVEISEERLETTGEKVCRPRLKCSGNEGTYIDCSKRGKEYIGLSKFDTYRLLADVDDSDKRSIAEVSYDTVVGSWIYSHLRKDKVEPNFIDVVLLSLIHISEPTRPY